jgi:ATP-dependent helicase/nuclease subunit A
MPHELPPWLGQAVPAATLPTLPLSPSRAYDEETRPVRPTGGDSRVEREKAMARGVLVHRLLQSLPDIPRAARADAARRHLARNGKEFSAEEREAMLAQVQAVLDDSRFSEVFSPGSRAEVPIVGRRQDRPVSGQVDRLALIADAVLIVDYKTNRIARKDGRERPYGSPERFEDVPPAYIRQLALYRAVLAELFPDKTIRAALLWTEIPDLMEIPAAAMDRELAAVTSP